VNGRERLPERCPDPTKFPRIETSMLEAASQLGVGSVALTQLKTRFERIPSVRVFQLDSTHRSHNPEGRRFKSSPRHSEVASWYCCTLALTWGFDLRSSGWRPSCNATGSSAGNHHGPAETILSGVTPRARGMDPGARDAAPSDPTAIARILGKAASPEEWDPELCNAETASPRNTNCAGRRRRADPCRMSRAVRAKTALHCGLG
jgi:hypothetical protein